MARTAYRDAATRTEHDHDHDHDHHHHHHHDRPSTSGSDKKDKELWSTLLDNVSSGKRLPEKNLIVLGGTQQTQKDFLDSLQQPQHPQHAHQHQHGHAANKNRPPDRSKGRKTPVANRFALGYTYQDVYDSDHDDVLARLSVYTLSSPSPAYAPLLARLLTPEAIPNTAVAILLDWAKPWTFARSLRSWIRLLTTVTHSLPIHSKYALDENTTSWHHARDAALATAMTDHHTSMPLGPGEYDEPLGLPLVVVCQNALAIESLEKERGYRESHFDYVLQFLRTVLLKHGAALVYTMPSQPGPLQPLLHSILNIQSRALPVTGKEKSERMLKHNVVDRERVLVPPAWDSWGKIRVLREGFDVEGISRSWAVEIQPLPLAPSRPTPQSTTTANTTAPAPAPADDGSDQDPVTPTTLIQAPDHSPARSTVAPDQHDQLYEHHEEDAQEETDADADADPTSTLSLYEETIQDPHPISATNPKIDTPCTPDQPFLSSQLDRLEAYRAEDEANKKSAAARKSSSGLNSHTSDDAANGSRTGSVGGAMAEHIGPVQFNMGGISYDAEDVLKRLKERNSSIASTGSATAAAAAATGPSTPIPHRGSQASAASTPFPPASFAPITTPHNPSDSASMATTAAAATGSMRGRKPAASSSTAGEPLPPTENLEAYFASLMKKGQRGASGSVSGSTTGSPKPTVTRERERE